MGQHSVPHTGGNGSHLLASIGPSLRVSQIAKWGKLTEFLTQDCVWAARGLVAAEWLYIISGIKTWSFI